MTRILGLSLAFSMISIVSGCQSASETKTENANVSTVSAQPSNTPNIPPTSAQKTPIDVPKFAGKSSQELDKVFGTPEKSNSVQKDHEFRLYKIAGQPEGLVVWFYGGRAKSFNLVLEKPVSTSKEALKLYFNIDVGNSAPVKDAKEPLTEKYKGTFNGVKFGKVSAKKQADGKGFIFVLAELPD